MKLFMLGVTVTNITQKRRIGILLLCMSDEAYVTDLTD
jgi:hypothetical protein